MKPEMYPVSSRIRFEFPAREGLPPVTFHWSDGGNGRPRKSRPTSPPMFGGISPSGCIMVGEKGMVFSPDDGDQELRVFVKLKDDKEMAAASRNEAAKAIPQTIPRNAFDNTQPPDFRHHQRMVRGLQIRQARDRLLEF